MRQVFLDVGYGDSQQSVGYTVVQEVPDEDRCCQHRVLPTPGVIN